MTCEYAILFSAPFVVTRFDIALAINSPNTLEISFMNVNSQKSEVPITMYPDSTLYPESVLKLKCAGFGNPVPAWSWKFTNLYTELTDYNAITTEGLTG